MSTYELGKYVTIVCFCQSVQITPNTIGVIQVFGSWMNACIKLCSQTHEWLFRKQGSFLYLLMRLPLWTANLGWVFTCNLLMVESVTLFY
jgi:hypothetical protein